MHQCLGVLTDTSHSYLSQTPYFEPRPLGLTVSGTALTSLLGQHDSSRAGSRLAVSLLLRPACTKDATQTPEAAESTRSGRQPHCCCALAIRLGAVRAIMFFPFWSVLQMLTAWAI